MFYLNGFSLKVFNKIVVQTLCCPVGFGLALSGYFFYHVILLSINLLD